MFAADAWLWVERITWIVTIAGVVATVSTLVLLLFQQRRVAEELSRRPRIRLGFVIPNRTLDPKNFAERRVIYRRALVDGPHRIGFGIANEGERTAFGLIHELIFPASVEAIQSWDGRGYDDSAGSHHLQWGPDDLHPRSGVTHYAYLTIEPKIQQIQVTTIATFRDAPRVEAKIELALERIS